MRKFYALAAIVLVALPVSTGLAQDDAALDPKYTWDLTEFYPTVDAWNEAREEVLA